MSFVQVVECSHYFNDGHTCVERDEHSGCPSLNRNSEVT